MTSPIVGIRILTGFGDRGLGRRLMLGFAALPLVIVVILVAIIVWVSVAVRMEAGLAGPFTLKHYAALFTDPLIIQVVLNTLIFAVVTVITAMTFGVAAAWLVERTDIPGKKAVYALMTIGLLFPTFFQAMGWMFFLHPRIGMFNRWLMQTLHLTESPFSIANVYGMGWVEGLGLASLAFVMTSPVLRAMNPDLEDAARVHGLGRWSCATRIVMPLIWPGLVAAAIYMAVIATATFEVPAVIGLGSKILTFSTLVYISVSPEMGVPNYGIVGAMSVLMIALSMAMSWWYFRVIRLSDRYAVVQGRGYRPRLIRLGRLRWVGWLVLGSYFVLAKLLPFLMMVWAALLPYFQPFSLRALKQVTLRNFEQIPIDLLVRGAANTFILMLTVPTAALVLGLMISWIVVRSGLRSRFVFDWIAFLPHAVPSLVFAIAAVVLALFVLPKGFPLYGTIFIVMAVYILVRISLTTRVLNGAILQIHRELEEAAYVSGMRMLSTMRKILLPLLMPALINLWLWNALLTFRELTMAAFLVTQDNITLPVVIWGVWHTGSLGQAAAASLVFVAMFLPVVVIYWMFGTRAAEHTVHG